jgi:hypothetical protein
MAKTKAKTQGSQQIRPYLAPVGGIRYDAQGDLIGDLNMSDCRNVRFNRGLVSKIPGTRRLGGNLPLTGSVMGLDMFEMFSGTQYLLAMSEDDIYVYNGTTKLWEIITKGLVLDACETGWTAPSGDTLTYSSDRMVGSYSTKIVLAAQRTTGTLLAYKDLSAKDSSTHTGIGFWIKSSVSLSAGAMQIVVSETLHASGEKTGTYTACDTPALVADTWTFVRATKTLTSFNAVVSVSLWAASTMAAGTEIYLDDVRSYKAYTGADSDYWTFDSLRQTNESDLWWLATNGVDPIQKWTGSGVMVDLITDYPSGVTSLLAKVLFRFKDYVMLGDVTENGYRYPQRVRWSDTAEPADFINNNALYRDIPGSDGVMGGLAFKNDYALIAKEKSFWVGYATGDTDIFSFSSVSTSIGCVAGRTLKNVEDAETIFLGRNAESKILDVYSYDGASIKSVGVQIRDELAGTVNSAQLDRCFARSVYDRKEYWLFVPPTGETYCSEVFIFNYELRSWSRANMSSYMQCGGMWEQSAQTRYEDLIGTYQQQNYRYCDMGLSAKSPMTVFGDTDGLVYEFNTLLHTFDVGNTDTAIDGWFTTKDFIFAGLMARQQITRVELYFSGGGSLDVSYSTDQGLTWSNPVTMTARSTFEIARAFLKINSNMARFKFRNAVVNEHFDFREARIYWSVAGARLT